ncbi:CDP-glycerol glycerophosphotransferase family protein [Stenotrophomonas mori]|uniref:CDP-glycerol glycerophosphotransferase family protein n=1 Tax=Stenotrophomonas mori TaxID=2871096 RepID=A0ABT0SDS7_9GAMM|nr:CDP-glycerol glycerophosphotransferase family protein [Stenotrophomonas mori]MCL7713179.1 CDP-glycerol glycerophosphotransferase family protein [Stenotrophomonas mori]
MTVMVALSGWLLIAPVAFLVPKRRDWVAVIGREGGRFLDNSKYFFLQAAQQNPGMRLVFVTEREEVARSLGAGGLEALCYPGWRAIGFLLRCRCVVVDEAGWYGRFRAFLLIRARIVQLWHGVGFKWIEGGLWANEAGRFRWASAGWARRLRLMAYRVTRRRIRYAMVATTSPFYRDRVFAPAFEAADFPVVGYPRNDFALSLEGTFLDLAWSNVDAGVRACLANWRRCSRRMVLVAPTFRGSGRTPMALDEPGLRELDAFAEAHGVEFVFKFHPADCSGERIAGRHFHVCARHSDIYPLFPHAAALVTDYSSIGMDFLLVDKPVLFLLPGDDDYAENDRKLQFDPRSMMPGPIAECWNTLLGALLRQWETDEHLADRAALREQAFAGLDPSMAVPELLARMREKGWLSHPRA